MNDRLVGAIFIFTLGVLVLIGVMEFFPESSAPLAELHPEVATLLTSTGDRLQPKLLVSQYIMGFLLISIMVTCIVLGQLKHKSLGPWGRWLWIWITLFHLIFAALVLSYANYQPGPDADFFLGFPKPTAWMIYGIWFFPFILIGLFMKNFDSWFVTQKDMETFNQLLAENTDDQGRCIMEQYRDTIVLVSVGIYMGLCVVIGIWAIRKTKSSSDFFMAGRHLGVMLTAFAVFSSTLSGFGFVGGPGLVYRMGMSSIWMVVCSALGYVISFSLLSKRIRMLGELRNCISLPDVVYARYKSDAVRVWISIAILLGVMGYLATQILAMAFVLQDILSQSGFSPNITITACVVISCAVLVFYTVTGGIVASVYTDLIQGGVMVVAAVLIFATVVGTYDGGFTEIGRVIMADDPEAIGPWGTLGMVGCLSWFFVFGLGGCGQPHIITKIMMNKKISDAKHILPVSTLGYLLAALLWIGIGLVMRALVVSGAHDPLTSPDAAAPQFLQHYAHPLLAGVVFAGLFAAIMSTADGFLNIGTAAIIHDIPKAIRGHALKNELFWARAATVIIAVVAAMFALYTGKLVALLGAFGWGTFAAAIVPVVALGLNWKRATPIAASVAVAASLAVNFGAELFKIKLPFHFNIGAFSLIISLLLFIGISLATKPKPIDPDVEAIMDM